MIGALAAWLGFSGVETVGEGACPDPAEVTRLLAQIAPSADRAGPAARRARLSRSADVVRVELLGTAGERLGERELDAGESCADLAAAAAVVVAAWEAELNPRVETRVSLPPPPARAATVVTAAPAPPAPPPRSGPRFDLGLGLLASLTGGQI